MDSPRQQLILFRNRKGITLVYIALIMVALCAITGLAVDIGYMYVAKGQLQNAADAAALAGASRLPDTSDARNEAVAFAAKNLAAGNAVTLSSSGENVLSPANDVTFGNWDPRNYPAQPYDAARTPINAVQARARRTGSADVGGQSAGGPIELFFSKVVGWPRMGASAIAIAQRPARAGGYFLISGSVCTGPLPATLSTEANTMAWTSLLAVPTGPGVNVNDLICGNVVPDVDVCSNDIYTTNGTTTVFKDMEADFYDPDYDRVHKAYSADGVVSSWTIIVPYVPENLDPTEQPAPLRPAGYAKIRMIKACGAGGGHPCNGNRAFFAPAGVCAGNEKDIVIDQITCVDCAHSSNLLGARPSLVQ